MIKIYCKSDFKLVEKIDERFAKAPFSFVYKTTGTNGYRAAFDGTTYTNCKRNDDGSITVVFNNHGLGIGKLKVRREFFIPDTDFPDGLYNAVSNDSTEIVLTDGKTDGFVVTTEILLPAVKTGIVKVEGNALFVEGVASVESTTLTLTTGKVENNILIL